MHSSPSVLAGEPPALRDKLKSRRRRHRSQTTAPRFYSARDDAMEGSTHSIRKVR